MRFLAMALFTVLLIQATLVSQVVAQTDTALTLEQRIRGLLVGSLLGDAIGGPVEFKDPATLTEWVPNMRKWSAAEFRDELDSGKLAARLKLIPYRGIRSDVAPYGPWEKDADPGTVTDDSRHKMILMHCLAKLDPETSLTARDLCQAYLDFVKRPAIAKRDDYVVLAEESFREYNSVARWLTGERDLDKALPPQRLWVGIGTCSGQMTLLPLACVYPGDPQSAYRAAYAIDFVDVGSAKDINAALVAGLAAALGDSERDVETRWKSVLTAIRETDPYRYGEVPFAKRPATEWLDFALDASKRAEDSPAKLFEILEKEGRPKYFWDAHFTYACAFAFLSFCDFQTNEALVTSLAFGHDTDSAAQVIGALGGAVHGEAIFPEVDVQQVLVRVKADYDEDMDEWVKTLMGMSDRSNFPRPIKYLEDE